MLSQDQCWAESPEELISRILDQAFGAAYWEFRQIAKRWRSIARHDLSLEATDLFLDVIPANILRKMQGLQQLRSSEKLPDVRFIVQLEAPLELTELADLTANLSKQIEVCLVAFADEHARVRFMHLQLVLAHFLLQAQTLTACTLELQLLLGCKADALQQQELAAGIAHSLRLLHEQSNIATSITVCAPEHAWGHPTVLTVFQDLRPWLHQVACCSMSDQDPAPNPAFKATHNFSSALSLALHYAGSPWHTVCIPTFGQCNIQCATITKLHIKFCGLSSPPVLSHLQCNKLQDLALETSESLSCPDMLSDSKQTLQHVNLAARNCCAATYKSLANIPQLETSIIRVWTVSATQASEMQRVQARSAQMVLHYNLSNALTKISMAGLRLHKLTLWKVTDKHLAQLQQLPCLDSLIIAHSPYFTGSSLRNLPHVTSLTLNLCKGGYHS